MSKTTRNSKLQASGQADARATAKKVSYAVVGLGYISQVAVLPAFQHARENSELVAFVSGDATKRTELAKKIQSEQNLQLRTVSRVSGKRRG